MTRQNDVRVSGGWRGIISETEAVPIISSPFIEYSLVSAIPTSSRLDQSYNCLKFLLAGSEHHHSRVKYIRPAHIWDCTEFIWKGEKMGKKTNGKSVCVEEDDLGILSQPEDVYFG